MSQGNQSQQDRESSKRIERILRQARHETGVRDVATFALGNAWSSLLIVGAVFYLLADQWARGGPADGKSTDDSVDNDSDEK